MKKQIFLVAILTLVFSQTFGQTLDWENSSEVEVWGVRGTVDYIAEDGSTVRVEEGMSIPDDATVKLKRRSSLELIYNGQPLRPITKKGTHSISDLKDQIADNASSGAIGDFWNTVAMSSKGTGGRTGPGSGPKGAGGNFTILPVSPVGSGVPSGQVNFSWNNRKEGAALYQLKVFSKGMDTPVFTVVTKKTMFSIDIDQIAVEADDEISWKVNIIGDNASKSDNVSFKFAKKGASISVLQDLKKAPSYKKSDDFQKRLMEAVTYEKNDMTYLAHQCYKKALKSKPNNAIVKKLYNSFLANNELSHLIMEE
jgi:hypothetical protein